MRYEFWLGCRGLLLACLGFVGALPVYSWQEIIKPGEAVNGVRASLVTGQVAVHPGQSLTVDLILENVSQRPLSVYRHIGVVRETPGYVLYHLIDSLSKQEVSLLQGIDDHPLPAPADYARLAPGEQLTQSIAIDQQLFDWRKDSRLKPGKYALKLEVVMSEEGRTAGVSDAWAGTLWTNSITFELRQ